MLTAIQQKLLQMMKEIDQVCRENDIHYSLGGGTAIGAIRHRGFIPWDDDIDLYMTRDNWEKFKQAERDGKLPANRRIESAETDISYTNTFGRYVTTDSSAVHSHQMVYDDPAGHVLDVFVFDPLHIDNYWRFLEDYMLYCDLMDESKSYSTRYDLNVDRYERAYARCRKEGKETVINELIDSFTHMDDPGWEHYIMEWGSAHFLFPASIFDGGYVRVPFEDTTVEIVRNFSEYLTWQYGDEWAYIPKHEGREGHDAIFSNEIPYEVVRDDYRPFVDFEEVQKAYVRRKKRLIKANTHRRKAQQIESERKAQECADALENKLKTAGRTAADLREMLENERYAEPAELFREYYDAQLSAEFIGRKDKHSKMRKYLFPQLVPVSDEIFVTALECLVRTERMSKARRLIEVFENDTTGRSAECCSRVSEIRCEIDEARALIDEYSLCDRDKTELMQKISAFLEKYPHNSQIMRLELRLLLEADAAEPEHKARAEKILCRLENVFSGNTQLSGELMKYRADLDNAGKEFTDETAAQYQRIYELSDNGYIRLETADLLRSKGYSVEEPEEESVAAVTAAPARAGRSRGLYGLAKAIYRKMAGRDDRLKDRAWEIACRTRDRVILLEKYEPILDELAALEKDGKWDELSVLMAEHEEAVLRNLSLELGLSVHPVLTEIQNELFVKSGRSETAQAVEKLIPSQHRKAIGR